MKISDGVKAVGQYVKRAEEMEKDTTNPDGSVIAFWCRQWAIIKLGSLKPRGCLGGNHL
jgi:hypothetical protein